MSTTMDSAWEAVIGLEVHVQLATRSKLFSGASQVVAWLDAQDAESVWISSVSVLEIRYGIELVDDNARRLRLERAFDAMLRQDLSTRIVSFDVAAAEQTARLSALARRQGRTIELRDAMIAGIAAAQGALLATRNTRHFAECGVDLVDPWQPAGA